MGCILLSAPTLRASFVIDSLTGDITANEISHFVSTIQTFTPPVNDYGNDMADHNQGQDCEGMQRMYDATGNVAILNELIKYCDSIMVHRDDQALGEHRVMWDGGIDPVWPSAAPTDPYPEYSGCESGQVAGHVSWCAWLILKHPELWNKTIPDGNPYRYGLTYRSRALAYISLLDAAQARYYSRWFISPSTHQVIQPMDPRWTTNGGGQNTTSWNRQYMFELPYEYLARCHDILGDHPAFLPFYKSVVKVWGDDFAAGNTPYVAKSFNVVDWYYYPLPANSVENIGHAQHDVIGLTQSMESGYSNITPAQMTVFAHTAHYAINLGSTDKWAGNVDGTGTPSVNLKSDFVFLAEYDRPLFQMIAQSNIDGNQIASGEEACHNTGYILWMKHWLFTH